MSSEPATQARLLGDLGDAQVHIETEGRVIRPALSLLSPVADEVRLRTDGDGLHVTAVDPANVIMIDFTLHAAAFDAYDCADAECVGVYLPGLSDSLRQARKGKRTSDPVTVDIRDGSIVTETEREYDGATATYADEVLTIDPDSVREEPNLPGLDLPGVATVPVDGFGDAVAYLKSADDHMRVGQDGGDLVLAVDGDEDGLATYGGAVRFGDCSSVDGEAPVSWYSLDYVVDMADALATGLVTRLEMEWGDEFPLRVSFAREQEDTTLYDGTYMLAPRVKSGGDA